MHLGAAGILCKDHGLGKIADALDVIAAGGAVFEPTAVSHASDRPATRQRPLRLYPLTPREREVLRRITAGQSTGQMADEMNIAINTLRSYVKNVLTKLGAHNRLQAAALATREDLLSELPA
jgi:DNA-binding NarL/FixJ family response regulator